MNKKEIGKLGEDLACKFLLDNGFEIIDRNYQKRIGEIDIISFKKGILHFFEVKTVSRETFNMAKNSSYRPEENVTREKVRKIEKTANIFLKEKGFKDGYVQIDLLTVYLFGMSDGFEHRNIIGDYSYFVDYFPNINFK